MANSNLLTPKQVSGILQISEKRVRYMCVNKELKAFKIGRQWRIYESSINEYLGDRRRDFENNQLAELALSMKSRKRNETSGDETRSLAMNGNGKKGRLPDKLSFGSYGYWKREYVPTKAHPDGFESWVIWWLEEDENGKEKRRFETLKYAQDANDTMEYLNHKRKILFEKTFCCPSCGYNHYSGEQEGLPVSKVTLKQVFEEYLRTKRSKSSYRTIENKAGILGGLLEDVLRLSDLTMKRVYKLKEQMEDRAYRGSTINTYLKTLTAILTFAKEDMNYIKEVIPVKRARADETDSVERRYTSASEFWAIYDALNSDAQFLKDMLIVGRTCGNRNVELETLEWPTVELNGGDSFFKIEKKNDKAKRGKLCCILEEVKPIFKRLKKEQNGNENVFTIDGRLIKHKSRYNEIIKQANIDAGIKEPYTFYELCRHSGITDKGHEPGISLAALMEFAGHSNPKTTERYLHSRYGKGEGITPREIAERVGC